jgi:hypothetical protein
MEYEVIWKIQLDADTPALAAEAALDMFRHGSDCTFFEVTDPQTGRTFEIDAGDEGAEPQEITADKLSTINAVKAASQERMALIQKLMKDCADYDRVKAENVFLRGVIAHNKIKAGR